MKLKFIITISETRLSADSPFSVEQGSSPYKSRPVKECRCPDRSPTAGFGKTFFKRRAEKAVGLGYIASENQDISLEAGQHRRNELRKTPSVFIEKSYGARFALTASAGEAIMAHRFKEYQPYKGDIERRTNGSMIAMETGTAFAYAIDKLQDRGRFFIYPQEEVYAGQVVGEHVHENDLVINVTKSKKLTNMRASGSDDKARIIPPVIFSLEEALEYIKEDEYVEVTPKSMRMRKVILDETERKRANKV